MLPNDDITLSKTIMFLRFPLIVAVVFIHTGLDGVMINGTLLVNEGQFPIYSLLNRIITKELACIAVPLFFFISGFLFFYRSDFSIEAYGKKLKKRVRTLLIPYVFWNVVVFLLMLFTQLFLSSMTSGRYKLIADYNWQDWLNIFWAHDNGNPICYQFWFMRDLMIVILFTPILHCYIKYCKALGVFALGVLWLFNLWFEVIGFSITAFFFFSFGAWFSINKHNFTVDFRSMRWPTTLIYLALVVLNTWLWHRNLTDYYYYVHNISIVIGLVASVSWTAYGIAKNRLHASAFLAGSSFFVYAYHGMPVVLAAKYWVTLLSPISQWKMLVGYFFVPFLIVGIGVCCYALLHKYFPTFTALVTGGR